MDEVVVTVGVAGMSLTRAAVGSEYRKCADCGTDTAFAPGSLQRIDHEGHIPVCMPCLGIRLRHDPDPQFIVPQTTVDELRRHYGG